MRVCYLIQSHKNPEQIYRLINTIKKSSPDSLVLVSHDFSCSDLDVAKLNHLLEVQVISGLGGRGDFSIVQGYLDAVNWLLSQNISFDWLTNISGQDYPTKPLSQVKTFLAGTQYDGFLEYFKVFSKESHWSLREGYNRYFYKYQKIKSLSELPEWAKGLVTPVKIINYVQPFFRLNPAYGMVGVRSSVPFDENFICYGGSFFCTLSGKCVKYLYEFYQSHPEIIDYYRGVGVSDESFIQTVLVNSGLFNLCNDNKFYFDFSRTRNGRPRLLTTDDYLPIVQSNAHFARKFDANEDSKILDLLDEIVLEKSKGYRTVSSIG
ncbi:beta-1,6-N-acetylglucosaminyltransferase [Scytonema sp. NUACC21]